MKNEMGSTAGSTAVRVAMVLIVVMAVVAWLAVGDTVDGSEANQRANAATLASGIAIADATTSLAGQLQNTVDALAVGTGSAAEASMQAAVISENARALLDIVDTLDTDASDDDFVAIETGLAEARAALLETQGGLDESQQVIIATQPVIQSAITALQPLGDQLRAAQAELADAVGDDDNQLGLWRTAIVLGTVALLLAFWAIDRSLRR